MVFGNHSPTQYPAIKNITIRNEPVTKYISTDWL